MKKRTIIIIFLSMVLIFTGCIPSQFTKGVEADEYPDRDLPIYDDAIIFEYDEDGDEVTVKYGTEDDVEDVMEFYQDYFDDEGIALDDEEEDDEEYTAEGFYEDFLFEISVEEADGDIEEKVFSAVAEVVINFLSDEEIEDLQGGNLERELIGMWELVSVEHNGTTEDMNGIGFAMEFFANGTMDMYLLYSSAGMTGYKWSVTDDGVLTYDDASTDEIISGTVMIENVGADTLLHISEDGEAYTLKKIEKDDFLAALDELDDDLVSDDWFDDDDDDGGDAVVVPNVGETQLLNQDGIIVTMKDFEEGYYSLNLNLMIENTTEKQLDVDLMSVVVNGYSLQDAYLIGTVEGNVKLNTEISFDLDELALCGIDEIVDIELVFEIYDYETWEQISVSDVVEINTNSNFVQGYDSSGTTMVDERGVKVVYQGFVTDDEYYGPYAVLYVENNTNMAVDLDCDNVQVNGFMVSGFLYGTVEPGTVSILTIEFYQSDLDDNGIVSIDEVKLSFQASYRDEWDYFIETDLMELPIN